jgi:hypothetical protein
MPRSEYTTHSPPLLHTPNCWRCNMPMWLVRIDPGDTPNQDKRMFECPDCEETEIFVVNR